MVRLYQKSESRSLNMLRYGPIFEENFIWPKQYQNVEYMINSCFLVYHNWIANFEKDKFKIYKVINPKVYTHFSRRSSNKPGVSRTLFFLHYRLWATWWSIVSVFGFLPSASKTLSTSLPLSSLGLTAFKVEPVPLLTFCFLRVRKKKPVIFVHVGTHVLAAKTWVCSWADCYCPFGCLMIASFSSILLVNIETFHAQCACCPLQSLKSCAVLRHDFLLTSSLSKLLENLPHDGTSCHKVQN